MSEDLLLIVADDETGPRIARFASDGPWRCDTVELGRSALALVLQRRPRLLLLNAPQVDHSHTVFCRTLSEFRERQNMLVVGLTSPNDTKGRLRLLDSGADDCWVEPYHSEEFRLRLKRISERLSFARSNQVIESHGIILDVEQHKVRVDGTLVPLTPTQFNVLRHFMEHRSQTFSRTDLLNRVWRAPHLQPETVTACVRDICRALARAGRPATIRTVGRGGYRLD